MILLKCCVSSSYKQMPNWFFVLAVELKQVFSDCGFTIMAKVIDRCLDVCFSSYLFLFFVVYFREMLGRKREELRNFETRITNATKGLEFNTCISELQTNLQKNQEYEVMICCSVMRYVLLFRVTHTFVGRYQQLYLVNRKEASVLHA
jgi:hypothetical protein